MVRDPLISVLLPARNADAYIDQAVESIVSQSVGDFEIIAVNDGSTDETHARLDSWSKRDQRVKIITAGGVGPAGALNIALGAARGRYLARMDADDISLPGRFAEQISYFKAHPSAGICGTWTRTFGVAGRHIWRPPINDEAIRARMRFDSPFVHPSVMMKREMLRRLPAAYRPEYGRAEDYDLWERLQQVCAMGNVPQVLLHYRMHAGQVTVKESRSSQEGSLQVRARQFDHWWPECSMDERRFHHGLCSGLLPVNWETFLAAERWLLRLKVRNEEETSISPPVWQAALAVKWWEVCRHFRPLGWRMLGRFTSSQLQHRRAIPMRRWLRLIVEGLAFSGRRGGLE